MKPFHTQGFTNQQALLALVLAFPLGLIVIGILFTLGVNRSQPEHQAIEPAAETPSAPLPRDEPVNQQREQPVRAPARQDPIDSLADQIFWRRHPSLQGLKLANQRGELAREWEEIRRCDAIVDHRFYQRFPQMRGRTIEAGNVAMVRAWTSIRAQVPGCS